MTPGKIGKPRENPDELKDRATYTINSEAKEKVRIYADHHGVSQSYMVQTFILAGSNTLQVLDFEDRIHTLDRENINDIKQTEEEIKSLTDQITAKANQLQRRVEIRNKSKADLTAKIESLKAMADELKKLNEAKAQAEADRQAEISKLTPEEAQRLAIANQTPDETYDLYEGRAKPGQRTMFDLLAERKGIYEASYRSYIKPDDKQTWDKITRLAKMIKWDNLNNDQLQYVKNTLENDRIDTDKKAELVKTINSWFDEPLIKED